MQAPGIINGFVILCGFQVLGDFVVGMLALPVPGAVIGMVLLFLWLQIRPAPAVLSVAAGGLLRWFGLLFVPAGVGLTAHLGLLQGTWPWLSLLLVLAATSTIAVTGLSLRFLLGRRMRCSYDGIPELPLPVGGRRAE